MLLVVRGANWKLLVKHSAGNYSTVYMIYAMQTSDAEMPSVQQ